MTEHQTLLPPPRIAALHDLSCFGRCALTVILPTLSVMGFQTVPVPTALLSTHTGGFSNLHFRDLTEDMQKIAEHFSALDLRFRAIYTGFLGSTEQIDTVNSFLNFFSVLPDESGKTPLILVDPVMGDDGELYSTYTPELAEGIRKLSLRADILTPNLTEAALLAGVPYLQPETQTQENLLAYATSLLQKLASARPHCNIVITGIPMGKTSLCNLGRNADGTVFSVVHALSPVSYPGTGDIFASVLLGKILQGLSFQNAVTFAAEFVLSVTEHSTLIPSELRRGVALEPELKRLV